MHNYLTITLLTAVLSLSLASTSMAGPRDDLLTQYASAAKAADPAFSDFSAASGKALLLQVFTGGKPDTASCTSCHGRDPRAPGRTLTGKAIEPMAVSVRTFLAAEKVCWNNLLRFLPKVPACEAAW